MSACVCVCVCVLTGSLSFRVACMLGINVADGRECKRQVAEQEQAQKLTKKDGALMKTLVDKVKYHLGRATFYKRSIQLLKRKIKKTAEKTS